MNTKSFKKIAETSDLSYWQVLMVELDSSLNRMLCITSSDLNDAYELEEFNNFWKDVKDNEAIVVSISDNANLYELSDSSILIVLIEEFNEKMLVFDMQDKQKLLNKLSTYQK